MGLSSQADPGQQYGLRPGKAPPTEAQKILEAAASKFASAGTLEAGPSAGGLSVRSDKPSDTLPKEVLPCLLNWAGIYEV